MPLSRLALAPKLSLPCERLQQFLGLDDVGLRRHHCRSAYSDEFSLHLFVRCLTLNGCQAESAAWLKPM